MRKLQKLELKKIKGGLMAPSWPTTVHKTTYNADSGHYECDHKYDETA